MDQLPLEMQTASGASAALGSFPTRLQGTAFGHDWATSSGRAGIKPPTYRLKELAGPQDVRGVNPNRIFVRRFLRLAARRDPAEAGELHLATRQLAVLVLAADEVRLAREVLEARRFVIVKGVELAKHLLAAEAADEQLLITAVTHSERGHVGSSLLHRLPCPRLPGRSVFRQPEGVTIGCRLPAGRSSFAVSTLHSVNGGEHL
jgi:hypothetical protein